ncbi:La- protein 7 [Perkinsus olseni]|uniref:La- protein 7 n=1 Tax=Perkinsus olseni TaxID=32597 RepID=A0A7J6QS77_PEROL|nr:La- protein 7 [Perkinsus olseni]
MNRLDRIQEQLEFYFSDANLRRDRYITEELAQRDVQGDGQPWVPTDDIITWGELRKLGCTETELLAAINNSEVLVLSEKEGKRYVSRNFRLYPMLGNIIIDGQVADFERRTVYMENLPYNVDRNMIKSVASGEKFGFAVTVDYIAIPNHPRTGVNLGYCFVEYNTEEEARTAKRQLDGRWPKDWEIRSDGRRLRVITGGKFRYLRDTYYKAKNVNKIDNHHAYAEGFDPAKWSIEDDEGKSEGSTSTVPPPGKQVREEDDRKRRKIDEPPSSASSEFNGVPAPSTSSNSITSAPSPTTSSSTSDDDDDDDDDDDESSSSSSSSTSSSSSSSSSLSDTSSSYSSSSSSDSDTQYGAGVAPKPQDDIFSYADTNEKIKQEVPSVIRKLSLLHLSGLPPVSLLQLRQWAGHSTVSQHVDIRPPQGDRGGNNWEAYIRLRSKKERDFAAMDLE